MSTQSRRELLFNTVYGLGGLTLAAQYAGGRDIRHARTGGQSLGPPISQTAALPAEGEIGDLAAYGWGPQHA